MKKVIFTAFLAVLLVVSMTVLASAGTIPSDAFLFDDFSQPRGMNTNDKPAHNGAGLQCWWHNFNAGEVKNKECELKDGILKIVYGFDMEDDVVYTWGNWGEAFDIHCTDSTGTRGDPNCQDYKYFHITIKGAKGGEEKVLIFNPAPEDDDNYSLFFDQLVLADGSHPKITTEWQTLKIDLAASGMPQVFNRFHIRSIKDGVTIYLDELYWTEPDGNGKKPVPNQNFTKLATPEVIKQRVAAFEKGTSASANPKTGDSGIFALVAVMMVTAAGIVALKVKKAKV